MNKYEENARISAYQADAYDAAWMEKKVHERFAEGKATEAEVIRAMEATEFAVEVAVANGCSLKDLPPV